MPYRVHSRFMNLFPSLFDLGLHSQSQFGNQSSLTRHAGGLRKQRIGLAVHLLQQKIQLLAGLAAGSKHFAKVLNVRLHARNLFRNIAALDQQRNLFKQPLAVDIPLHPRQPPLQAARVSRC
jgi:hypothetical protein